MPSYLIRNLDPATHTAAKTLAAHQGVSLDKFIKDAIHHECLRVAHNEGLTEAVIRVVESEKVDAK